MDFKHYSICDKCAKARGGKWPKGHYATVYVDMCQYCKVNKTIIPVSDFIWPGQKKLVVWD